MIAFSIALIELGSNGWIVSIRGSGTLIVASCLSGVGVPVVVDVDAVEQRGRRAAGAHGVELVACVLDRLVHAASRRPRSGRRWWPSAPPFRVEMIVPTRSPRDDAADVARRPARRRRSAGCCPCRARARSCPSPSGRARSPRRCVSSGRNSRVRIESRVAVVHALDAVLGHQDRLGADLERAQRGGRVGREERVAGAGREDHDAALLEMPDRAAADVRLGDLGDRRSRTCTRVCAPRRSSASWSASELSTRREHSRVVGGRAVHPLGRRGHAAVDVPAADDDRDLDARRLDLDDLLGDARRSSLGSMPYSRSPISASPESLSRTRRNGLPRPACGRGFLLGSTAVIPRARSARTRAPRRPPPRAPGRRSCRVVDPRLLGRARSAAKKRLLSMPSTIFSRACSGFDWTSSEFA